MRLFHGFDDPLGTSEDFLILWGKKRTELPVVHPKSEFFDRFQPIDSVEFTQSAQLAQKVARLGKDTMRTQLHTVTWKKGK